MNLKIDSENDTLLDYKSRNPLWWVVNTRTGEYVCADQLLNVCGVEKGTVLSQSDFVLLINPAHKNKILDEIRNYYVTGVYREEFQLLTKFGYRWVCSTISCRYMDENGDSIILGSLEFLTDNRANELAVMDSQQRINGVHNRYSSVSTLLGELIHGLDISSVVTKILNGLLEEFNADRAYLFEFDSEKRTHSCIYEVTRGGIGSSIDDLLRDVPMETTSWWSHKLFDERVPITCTQLIELLPHDKNVYDILKAQDIEALMVVPWYTKDGGAGYMGLDIVGRRYVWTEEDIIWFKSLVNVISLCIELKKAEETAQQEQEHYRRLYENMPIGFARLKIKYDEQGIPVEYAILDSNPEAAKLGLSNPEKIRGCKGSEVNVDRVSFQKELLVFDNLLKTRSIHKCTSKMNALNRVVNCTFYASNEDQIIVLLEDTTESVEISKALYKSEETLEKIYNNIPVGIEIYDKNGILIDINDIEMDIFGLKCKADALGINLFENPNVPTYFLEDLKNQRPSWCDFYYDFDKVNEYYQTKYTGKKHIVLKGSILYDVDKNVENYLFIVIDNTDSLQANHKIREFEMLFDSIAEFSEVGLLQWNPCKGTLFGTDQWFSNLSIANDETSDLMVAYRNVSPQEQEVMRRNMELMISGDIESCRQEIRVCKDGELRWLRANYKVVDYAPVEGGVEIVGINIDITELKRTEEKLIEAKLKAEQSDKLKSAFLANMSHEIRTPLNSIVGFSDLLMYADDIQEREQYVKIIKQSNELLLQLISDILDLSKIESGFVEINPEVVSAGGVCEEIVCSLARKARPGVRLFFQNQGDDCFVLSDKNRLTQVLINLVGNAIKFTNEGEIVIGFDVEGDTVRFYVRDTGLGMQPEKIDSVFGRFVKLNEFIPGTGLGLSICKSLIEAMNGRIWVESEIGVGSCFQFTQPLSNSSYLGQMNQGKAGVVAEDFNEKVDVQLDDDHIKPLILVAEDTDSNFSLVSTILKKNYSLLRAHNGQQAVEMVAEFSPNLVLMDVKMPTLDGLEAMQIIKEFNPDLPVVILTAYAYNEEKIRSAEYGCDDFLTKPVNYTQLMEVVHKYI